MSEKVPLQELIHRRSSVFIDEFVDRYSVMAISWNGDERLHITFGRDSLEVISESIVPDPENPAKAILGSGKSMPYRNDVASLTMPIDVAEKLGIALLRMAAGARERESSGSDE